MVIHSFTLRFWSSKRFSGLRSLCTTLCRWQYSTPDMICWKNLLASSSFNWKKAFFCSHNVWRNNNEKQSNLPVLDNIIEELPARDVLHDHEDVGGSGDDLVQLDYVRVAEKLQVLDFPANLSHHVQGLDLLPIQNFHSNLVSGHLMKGN